MRLRRRARSPNLAHRSLGEQDWLVNPHPNGGEVYRIEKGAFAETYTAVFVPVPKAELAPGRKKEERPDHVRAALGEMLPPAPPDDVPWRWRAEGRPELASAPIAASDGAAAGGGSVQPGGWGRVSVGGWQCRGAGCTLTVALQGAATFKLRITSLYAAAGAAPAPSSRCLTAEGDLAV